MSFIAELLVFSQEEETILRERDRYELEKGRLIREMKRIRDEDGSRFNNFQILNHRYALLNLLGKGGFSEVYKVRTLVNVITVNDCNMPHVQLRLPFIMIKF